MAAYYVYSGAGGSNNGSSWANAFTTLTTAFATEAAGDTLYVAHDHAETTAGSVTLTSSGTITNPTKIICVNRSGSVPPVAADLRATATVTSTSNNNLTFSGCAHYDGIIFSSGTGAVSSANIIVLDTGEHWHRFDNCALQLNITSGSSKIILAGGAGGSLTGCYVELNNTPMKFGATTHTVANGGIVHWRNTPTALSGTMPSQLFTPNQSYLLECCGVDLSALGANTIMPGGSAFQGIKAKFLDCKLHASSTKVNSNIPGRGSSEFEFLRSGSAAVNYAVYSQKYGGTLIEETTIVRTGGASDGTTPLAWKIVTTSGSNYSAPFECPPIAIWNDTTGSSVTATIEGIWGGGAVPNDDDVWVDVEYLSDASSPQGALVNDGKASILATAAGQTSSLETWGGSTTKFKLAVAFTPQQAGWVYARVKCAKTSTTFYVDPMVTLS